MTQELLLVLVSIIALTVLGLAVVFRGGRLRASRDELEVTSDKPSDT